MKQILCKKKKKKKEMVACHVLKMLESLVRKETPKQLSSVTKHCHVCLISFLWCKLYFMLPGTCKVAFRTLCRTASGSPQFSVSLLRFKKQITKKPTTNKRKPFFLLSLQQHSFSLLPVVCLGNGRVR